MHFNCRFVVEFHVIRMMGHLADVAIDDFTLTPECFGLGTLITVLLLSLLSHTNPTTKSMLPIVKNHISTLLKNWKCLQW